MTDQSSHATTTKKGRRRLPGIVVKLAVVGAAIGVLAAVSKIPRRKRDSAAAEAPPVNVSVMTVTAEAQLADTIELPGVVEPNRVVTISAELAGRIEQIACEEGCTLSAGELLIETNSELIVPQLRAAEAQYERDRIEFERMSALVKDDSAGLYELDDATNRLAASKALLEEIRARLDRTRILAPIPGVLNELFVEAGEYVQEGMAVAKVVETDIVKVAVDVPERDIGFFEIGGGAEIFADVKGREQTLVGTTTFISELADERTRSTRMEIRVENKQRLLRSGQIVRVGLTRRILEDAILIPLLAVIPMENAQAVYVVNSAEAQRREVELGIIKGDRIQVTRGLAPGERLIVAGHRFVAPGQKVQITSESK